MNLLPPALLVLIFLCVYVDAGKDLYCRKTKTTKFKATLRTEGEVINFEAHPGKKVKCMATIKNLSPKKKRCPIIVNCEPIGKGWPKGWPGATLKVGKKFKMSDRKHIYTGTAKGKKPLKIAFTTKKKIPKGMVGTKCIISCGNPKMTTVEPTTARPTRTGHEPVEIITSNPGI